MSRTVSKQQPRTDYGTMDRAMDRFVAGLVALALPFLAASSYFSMQTLQAGTGGAAAWAAVVVQAGLMYWMGRFAVRTWRAAGAPATDRTEG
jgi:hypothetical protein